ncbi:class I SAM-dependent methyltransferase [Brevibacillus choshinensis]|uniref:SAM-dependent methyltransferase n=1 Tax=Brevibacillus choshinensis TaxID=54911 RepID=A0ABX7FHV6_BRECH|nr:SAM-dependent methyltransferase [Brevibacillus choshinensis]QRG65791.1 SAM-dependent methyltransferase [Brevibacillus choshinensis]
MNLYTVIREEMAKRPEKAIPFSRYMELALYHPAYGYYMSDKPKVGKGGDFFTSASVHPVFGETIADAVVEMWRAGKAEAPVLVEIGGGTGSLCRNMLDRLKEAAPELYQDMTVMLIESSPYHRKLQQDAILAHDVKKVWYSSLEEAVLHEQIEGVILSNEWLDAFPVHVVEKSASGWQEVWVAEEEGRLREKLGDLTPGLADYLAERNLKGSNGMRLEINLGLSQAAKNVSRLLKRGYVLTIDYGDQEEELYHPSRKNGTLMCYYKHQAHDDPFAHPGEEDITAHVNFTAWREYGEQVGLGEVAYMRQDQFLMRSGLLHKAVAHMDRDPFTSVAMKRNRAIQQLVDPAGLGGRFRVMVQAKGIDHHEGLRFVQPAFRF